MGLSFDHLGILVTTYCNLNCRNCADLIPHRKNYHYPLPEIEKDLSKVLEVVDAIEEVLIIGGETLMYPDVRELLEFCRSQKKIKKIIFISNGKTLPDKALLDSLTQNGAVVRISGYSDRITPQRREAVEMYRGCGLTIDDLEDMSWGDIGDNSFRYRNEKELTEVFATCGMRYCKTLVRGGYIVYCSRQCAAMDTDLYPYPGKNEIIDVRSSADLSGDISKFLALPYISTCNYCNGLSHLTTRWFPSGIQILPKTTMLRLIEDYFIWTKENNTDAFSDFTELLMSNEDFLIDVDEYVAFLNSFKAGVDTAEGMQVIIGCATGLLNRLIDDYDFINSEDIPFRRRSPLYYTWNPEDKEDIPTDAVERVYSGEGLGVPSGRNAFFTEIQGG